jgi:DNA polymerase III sliding clamp (beta) subunit (PCNA family)
VWAVSRFNHERKNIMSKIQLPIAELKPALAGLGKVIQKSTTLPVLKTVKVERTREGWITLTGTDLDAFITVRLEEPVAGEPTAVLVPFDDLAKTTKGCAAGESITIESSGKAPIVLHYPVGQQSAQIRLESPAVEEFPPVPKIKSEPVPLSNDIRTALLEAMECASTDATRYILQGACIDVTDKKCNYLVGTDGRHLYSSNSFALPLAESLIIPTHKFLGWKEFNADGEWQLRVPAKNADNQYLQISSRRWRFIHRGIEGQYPNWRQIVRNPDETKTSIELDPSSTDSVIALIARIPNHDKVNRTIGIEIKGRHIHLLGKSQASEQWTRFEVEPSKTTGRDVTVYLNRDYLAKALRFGLSRIEIIDEMSPLRFTSGSRQMIVMPVRPDAARVNSHPTPPAAQPAATNTNPPPEEAQEERNTTMRQPNGSATGTPTNGATRSAQTTEDKSALETALAQVEIVRGDFRNAIAGLNKLCEALKAAQRDQKTADKEVQSARQTLEKLQSVRI